MPRNTRRATVILAAAVFCGIGIAEQATGQEVKPLAVEDALRTKQFAPLSPLALSPDGHQVAYTVQDNQRANAFSEGTDHGTSVPFWGMGTDIWIQDIESGKARNLTAGKGDNWLPAWSPDGRFLAFFSNRDGSELVHLWVWDAARDEFRKVSEASIRGKQIEWTRDARQLLVTTVPEGGLPENPSNALSSGASAEGQSAGEASRPTVVLYEGKSDSHDAKTPAKPGPWSLGEETRDLVSVAVASGDTKILAHGARIATYLLSPDGSRIAYTIPTGFEKAGSQQILFDLAIVGVAGDRAKIIASDIRLGYNGDRFSWSPDSSQVSYRESGPRMAGDCYVLSIDGKRAQNVTAPLPGADRSFSGPPEPLWDAEGKSIFFIHGGALWQAAQQGGKTAKVAEIPARKITGMIAGSGNLLWTPNHGRSTVVLTHDDAGKQDGFYEIDLRSGKSHRLLENGECYTCSDTVPKVAVTEDGQRFVYSQEDAQHENNLWVSDPSFQNSRRLTDLNPQFNRYEMGAARLIDWLSDDGRPLQGALLLPPGYQEGMRYPLIVWVYGGVLLSNNLDQFGLVATGPFNMQLFATRGYAILLPDMPLGVGTPMLEMAKAVLPGVNKLVEMGIADPERLGIMGHSFGGYSTLSLIVMTDRFRAAIESSGIGDLIGNYGAMGSDGTSFGMSIEEQGAGSMGGTPWEVRDRYIENSPVFYLDRIKTPLLIVHGTEDRNVASFLADEVFVGLRRLGKDVEYARYEGEGHSPLYWRYQNQVDFCNRIIAWLDAHLRHP